MAVLLSPAGAAGAITGDPGSDLLPGSGGIQGESPVPNLVISNINVTGNATLYFVTGDVTNTGTGVAETITASMGRPAVPAEPHRVYAIGTLNPNDFSSFNVSFTIPAVNRTASLLVAYTDSTKTPYHTYAKVTIPDSS